MSVHSWHHYTRWPEVHPFADRKRRQRQREDDLRAAFGIVRGVIGGVVSWVACAVIWEMWRG